MNYILLSTYNGEEYVAQLLDSVIAQQCSEFTLLIRDDGSIDRTREILSSYSSAFINIKLFLEENIGVVKSFLTLLDRVPPDFDYVGFCDQDDIWESDKFAAAILSLTAVKSGTAGMYCSRMRIVDNALRLICLSDIPKRGPSFENALVQNIATGCTIVLNKSAVGLLRGNSPDASNVWMHDAWAYLVVSAFGTVIFDPIPRINYRQHEANVVGHPMGIQQWFGRLKRFWLGKHILTLSRQAHEFHTLFHVDLPPEKLATLEKFIHIVTHPTMSVRFRSALSASFHRQRRLDTLLFRLLLLAGRV